MTTRTIVIMKVSSVLQLAFSLFDEKGIENNIRYNFQITKINSALSELAIK